MKQSFDKMYSYCFRILGIRPYTESEMRQKIHGHFKEVKSDEIETVIEKLKELNYLNDQAFAENYIEYRSKLAPKGKFVLQQELSKKGIKSDLIEHIFKMNPLDEITLAAQLVRQKERTLINLEPQKRKEKLMRFLLSRGFSYEIIKEVVKKYFDK